MFTFFIDAPFLAQMSDAYLRLKVRELQHWHDDAKDAEWRTECAQQLAAFNAEIARRGC